MADRLEPQLFGRRPGQRHCRSRCRRHSRPQICGRRFAGIPAGDGAHACGSNATRAAVEEGILPGGGVALLRAVKALDAVQTANDDQRVGVDIVRRAIEAPVRQIAENAGAEGSIVVGKLREKPDFSYGWNAQTGEYGDLYAQGVIDPVKVVRTALQDAASVAGLLVTTEAMIAEKPKKDAAPAVPAGPGMDF